VSRTVLVTGATDGLGRAVAADLVRAGHNVLVHGRELGPAYRKEIKENPEDETGVVKPERPHSDAFPKWCPVSGRIA